MRRSFTRGTRFGCAAHPDPHDLVAFFHGIRANARHFGDLRLAWNFHASSIPSEEQAVVAAADRRALDGSAGQRKMTVATAILQRGHFAIGPEQHHGVAK
jgi:hypothetical protein